MEANWDEIKDKARDQAWRLVNNHVWRQIYGQIWNQVMVQVWNQTGINCRDRVWVKLDEYVFTLPSNNDSFKLPISAYNVNLGD